MRHAAAALAFSLLPFFASTAGAVSDPRQALNGVITTAPHADRVPIRCQVEMQRLDSQIKDWKNRMTNVVREEKKFRTTVGQVRDLYRTTPADGIPLAVGYFTNLDTALGSLVGYMDDALSRLNHAEACIWDARWKLLNPPNCTGISMDCVDEGAILHLLRQSKQGVDEIKKNLTDNRTELCAELPNDYLYKIPSTQVWWQRSLDEHVPCHKGAPECTYTICKQVQPVCRQHLDYTIGVLIQAEGAVYQLFGAGL